MVLDWGITGQAGFAVCATDLIQIHEFNGCAQGIADRHCQQAAGEMVRGAPGMWFFSHVEEKDWEMYD